VTTNSSSARSKLPFKNKKLKLQYTHVDGGPKKTTKLQDLPHYCFGHIRRGEVTFDAYLMITNKGRLGNAYADSDGVYNDIQHNIDAAVASAYEDARTILRALRGNEVWHYTPRHLFNTCRNATDAPAHKIKPNRCGKPCRS
jgi:hypothetical protein